MKRRQSARADFLNSGPPSGGSLPTPSTVVAGLAVASSCRAVAAVVSCAAVKAVVSCAAVEAGGGAVHGHDGHVAAVATVDRLNNLDKLFEVSPRVLLRHV